MSTIREKFAVDGSRIDRWIVGNRMIRKGIRMGVSAVFILVAWQLVSTFFFGSRLLPAPTLVAEELLQIFDFGGPRGRSAWYHVERSLVRVIIAASLAMSLAIVLGTLMGVSDRVEDALSTWLPFWMTFPTVVIVLVAMVMFEFSQLSVIVAVVFAATPFATVNTWKGVRNIDAELLEMAAAFKVGQATVWRDIYLPGMLPNIFGSLRYIISMVWKIVVLAEVFGLDDGLGAMFRFWYNQASISTLLAYLFLFIFVMFVIEYGLLYPVERYLFRWRD